VVGAGVGGGAGAVIGKNIAEPDRPHAGPGYRGQSGRSAYAGDYGSHPSCNGRKVGHWKHGKFNKHGC
jgi:hypothetical protein